MLRGSTSRDIAIKLQVATDGMNNFIAIIDGKEYVISSITWVPVYGSNEGQCVTAESITPQHVCYNDMPRATAEEQALINQVKWEQA